LPGFQYADVPQLGPSLIVVTDNDSALARREADRLTGRLWEARERLTTRLPDAAVAVRQAREAPRNPVVLVDTDDNVGGGSAADESIILAEMLRQKATGSVVCLYAPAEVEECARAGQGNDVRLHVGGKVDRLRGDPVDVAGRVRLLHDGTYIEPQVRHGGRTTRAQSPWWKSRAIICWSSTRYGTCRSACVS
jgi:microcystin degradation protein MlrC